MAEHHAARRAAVARARPQRRRPAARRSSARGAGRGWRRGIALPIAAAMTTDDPAARLAERPRRDRHARAALAGRKPTTSTLIAVSKTHAAEAIAPLIAAGQRVFGENRVQEAQAKWPALRERHPGHPRCTWSASSSRTRRRRRSRCSTRSIRSTARRWSTALGQGDGQGRPAPRLLRPGQYRRRAAEGRLRGRRPAGAARRGARRRPAARRADVRAARRGRARALFRAARQAGARSWPGRAQHGHVGRFRDRGDARRDPCPGRHRAVRGARA